MMTLGFVTIGKFLQEGNFTGGGPGQLDEFQRNIAKKGESIWLKASFWRAKSA
jgi:hypothetical protein